MKKSSFLPFVCLVALLALSLGCNASSLGSLFATKTPTATSTPLPTQTPTITPSPEITLTFTPVPTGTSKTTQPDGSTLFADYDNQYSIVFPQEWTAITLDPEDFNKIMDSAGAINPEMKNTLDALKNLDPNSFRIFAFDFRPEHLIDGATSNVTIAVEKNSLISGMTLQNILDATTQALPTMYPGITILASKVTASTTGIPLGVIETNMEITTSIGTQITMYQQMDIVQIPDGILEITFSAHKSLQGTLMPEFQSMLASFVKTEE